MKARFGKYNSHPKMKYPVDNSSLEFPMSEADNFAQAMGVNNIRDAFFTVKVIHGTRKGLLFRAAKINSPGAVLLGIKKSRVKKDGTPTPSVLSFSQTERSLTGLTTLPPFALDHVDCDVDYANHQIFIPVVPEDRRRMPRQMERGSRVPITNTTTTSHTLTSVVTKDHKDLAMKDLSEARDILDYAIEKCESLGMEVIFKDRPVGGRRTELEVRQSIKL